MNAGFLASDQVGRTEPAGQPSAGAGVLKTSKRQLDILLTWRGRVGLFKKSRRCSSAGMPWQLLSVDQVGSCSALDDELLQCIQLLHRGTGLTVSDILAIRSCPTVELSHGSQCTDHLVYVVETNRRRLALGPGYSTYRWVKPPRIRRFDGGVDWLAPILKAATPRPSKPVHPGEKTMFDDPPELVRVLAEV
jgi:hypothetical protein